MKVKAVFLGFMTLLNFSLSAENGKYLSKGDHKFLQRLRLEDEKNQKFGTSVILTAHGTEIPVDKSLLGKASGYFEMLFTIGMKETFSKKIPINDIDEDLLLKAIRLVYSPSEYDSILIGDEIDLEATANFFNTLDYFQLDELKAKLIEDFKPHNDKSMREIFILLDQLQLSDNVRSKIINNCRHYLMSEKNYSIQEIFKILGKDYFANNLSLYELFSGNINIHNSYKKTRVSEEELKTLLNLLIVDDGIEFHKLIKEIEVDSVRIPSAGGWTAKEIGLSSHRPHDGSRGDSLLITAIRMDALNCVKELINFGANPDSQTSYWDTIKVQNLSDIPMTTEIKKALLSPPRNPVIPEIKKEKKKRRFFSRKK